MHQEKKTIQIKSKYQPITASLLIPTNIYANEWLEKKITENEFTYDNTTYIYCDAKIPMTHYRLKLM